jgi:aerobic-type carbon monoxide dehydrogenase small subunit (CoxS/CutS family)/CO/xanthine dehydrogenase FAD-binding subunit
MLARGIRSYHRPQRMDEALSLASQGITPLAGGTRLLSRPGETPNILDLAALGLGEIRLEDGDLVLGSMVTLQGIIDSPLTHAATAGLLPSSCELQSASRMIRQMATVGGEAVTSAHDSDLVTALLALNAIFVVARTDGPLEVPALRFLKNPGEDLRGGLLESIVIPGPPGGAAIERLALLTSSASLLSVAVTVTFGGDKCVRARIAISGLKSPPSRVLEAEAKVEGSSCEAPALERCLEQAAARPAFRDDDLASAGYRRAVVRPLLRRALDRAIARARGEALPEPPRRWPQPKPRHATPPTYFTSGRIELSINGESVRPEIEARTTLLELLRREGLFGAKSGCEAGECGACAVLLDGRPVNACLTLAIRAFGRSVQTVEGLGRPGSLRPVQKAFLDEGLAPCGFCTPAMEVCARALLDALPSPTEAEVRDALSGCLCRCTGYRGAVSAVLHAAVTP